MATVSEESIRSELADIGRRRDELGVLTADLAEDTRKAIKRAKGVIAMTEVAQLVKLERTSMYHTYAR